MPPAIESDNDIDSEERGIGSFRLGSDELFNIKPWYKEAAEGAVSGAIAGACTVVFGALITKLGNVVLHAASNSVESLPWSSLSMSACLGGAMLGVVLGFLQGSCLGHS